MVGDGFVSYKPISQDINWCTGVLWIIVMCLSDSHSDGTHSLQSIHCWDTDAELHFSKSVLMKKQSPLHLEWPEVSECEFLLNYSYKMRQMEENKRNSQQWWSIKEVVFAKQTHLTLTTLALSSPSVSSTAHHASWRIEDPSSLNPSEEALAGNRWSSNRVLVCWHWALSES